MKEKAISRNGRPASCPMGLCCTRIEGVGAHYGRFEALRGINMHIHCGELTAVIGPNGAGKSTLLKALLGEIPHTGSISFLDEKDSRTGKPLMGYVPQKLEFDGGSPTSVYDLFAASLGRRAVWLPRPKRLWQAVRDCLGLAEAGHLIDRRLGELSGGELQRVLLALALHPLPDLLLLDEPVSGVDHNGLKLFYDTVSALRREYDLSIILVSHDLELVARHADRVVLLHNRTVECSGTPQEVFSNDKVIELFGLNILKAVEGSGRQ